MPGPVLGLGTDTKKVLLLRSVINAFMERSTNFNRHLKEGMTGSICGVSVQVSWGPDP